MNPLLIAFPGNEHLSQQLASVSGCSVLRLNYRNFPDGESYLQIESQVRDQNCVVVCSLDRPDTKSLALFFLSSLLKDLGAKKIGLIAPYLSYMRQDKVFHPGEALTSAYFAKLISQHYDWLATVDPHLHRRKSLDEIYSIPSVVVESSTLLSQWIMQNVNKPLLIGPDDESRQWVGAVAQKISAPFTVLQKNRKGDRDIEVSVPEIEQYLDCQPVLLDDIVSSGRTMIETVKRLSGFDISAPICLVVHPVFADSAYRELRVCGAHSVLSCNTIEHESNALDVTPFIWDACVGKGFV